MPTPPNVKLIRTSGALDMPGMCASNEGVFEYWLQINVPGAATQEVFSKLMKDAKKNAQFPGFRKGVVPPFAMPKLVEFVIEESINVGLRETIMNIGIFPLSGADHTPKVRVPLAAAPVILLFMLWIQTNPP